MRSFFKLFFIVFFLPIFAYSQGNNVKTGEYLRKSFETEIGVLNYRIMYPLEFEEGKKYPLVLFLHGMGERGADNEKQLIHGSKLFMDSLEKYPAIVIFPQCPETDYWANISRPDEGGASRKFSFFYEEKAGTPLALVISLVEEFLQKPYVDEDRYYVSGLSMGGMGAFEITWRMQDKVAACMPICGGGPNNKADEMTDVPYWVFHGVDDQVVNPNFSIELVKKIQQAGGKAKLTLFPDVNHNSWDPAFSDPDFLKWMFSKRNSEADSKSGNVIYKPVLSPEVEKIFSQMTLDEKIGQLNLLTPGGTVTGEVVSSNVEAKIKNGQVGGIFGIRGAERVRKAQKIAVEGSRLGIPLIVGMDVIHGHQTMFPIPLALSCSWDPSLIEKTARMAAREATADGIMWCFSPMVDIARDPRWGRIAEGAGEDPFLGSQVAKAMVRGYQGEDFEDPTTMLACVKHFANYGAPEGGRDYGTVDMSNIRSYNEYLPPYKAAIDEGVASVMTSFNVLDYVPASASKKYMTDILRKNWGFEGFIVTDYTTILEMIEHGVGDLETVSAKALKAGVDMDMVGESFQKSLKDAVNKALVTEEEIDLACRRILEAKEKLGLFEDPYRYFDEERAEKEIMSEENRKFAREVAAQTFVLLKNENALLPLEKKGKIALIGPLADSRRNMLGIWSVSGDHTKAVTILEAMENALEGKAELFYSKGANISNDSIFAQKVNAFGPEIVIDERSPEQMVNEALEIANKSDVIIVVVGEAADMSGEASSMVNIGLQPAQRKLLEALKETGKPIVMLLYNGRPMTLVWEQENMDAILDVWFGGTEGANAVADVVFGDTFPGGKLSTSFPVHVGQIPVYHSMLNTGRPAVVPSKFRSKYLDIPNEPLYPFGYGLSYTEFKYENLELNKEEISKYNTVKASIEITNTGKREGSEVVQLYIRDLAADISRPMKELKGFEKIWLKAGEKTKVVFTIDRSMLGYFDDNYDYSVEPGTFEVLIGPDSAHLHRAQFELK